MFEYFLKAGYDENTSRELVRLNIEYGRKVESLPKGMTIPELEYELQRANTLGY